MLRKSIAIGSFALKNNRIGELKDFREGRKCNCPHVFLFQVAMAGTGK